MSTPAVVTQIAGGLGNQLFEYAFARSLSLRNCVPLVLDHRSAFPRDFYRRSFTLDKYCLGCDFVPPAADYSTLVGRVRRRLARWPNKFLPIACRNYIVERDHFAFDPVVATMRVVRTTYFEGLWQHEEYFAQHRDTLLQDLRLKAPVSATTNDVATRIDGSNAVCLHVRRLHGVPNRKDAIPLPLDGAIHLDPTYYERAVAFVAERISNPTFYVFADFIDWARDNVRIPFPVEYVAHNGSERDYEDLWLMSRCRTFIIANSTFSWWAAWLGTHPHKLVVAPESGIGCGLKSIPATWHRL